MCLYCRSTGYTRGIHAVVSPLHLASPQAKSHQLTAKKKETVWPFNMKRKIYHEGKSICRREGEREREWERERERERGRAK